MIFPQYSVFIKTVGRYMTKFLAVKTMCNSLYVVFTIKIVSQVILYFCLADYCKKKFHKSHK